MKPRDRQSRSLNVSNSRWLAYVTAGLGTPAGGAISAEAAIHYSGPVDYTFRGKSTLSRHTFPLSNGAHLVGATAHVTFAHYYYAYFGVDSAKVSNSLRGPGSVSG